MLESQIRRLFEAVDDKDTGYLAHHFADDITFRFGNADVVEGQPARRGGGEDAGEGHEVEVFPPRRYRELEPARLAVRQVVALVLDDRPRLRRDGVSPPQRALFNLV